jgi:NADPH:quinone reductase-like Zn-dependent oxidoreductase
VRLKAAKASVDVDGKPTLPADAIANARDQRAAVLAHYAALASEGRMRIPIAQVFPLEDWRAAMALSRTGNPRGKVILRLR